MFEIQIVSWENIFTIVSISLMSSGEIEEYFID